MIFDVYFPFQNKYGVWTPGVKPKPLDWTEILKIAESENVANIYNAIRASKDKDEQSKIKMQLPAICYTGRAKGEYRRASEMIPTQCVMIDIDHCEGAQLAWETIKAEMGEWCSQNVILAALTPRLGLRIVFAAQDHLSTLQENMDWFNKQFKLERFGIFDAPCKDFSRLSFIFKRTELLYESTRLYLNTGLNIKENLFNNYAEATTNQDSSQAGDAPEKVSEKKESQSDKAESPEEQERIENEREFTISEIEDFQSYDYNGTPLSVIVNKWVEVKGKPGRSQIHNYYNEMVKYFRNIADNNKRLLLYLLPRFGHTIEECKSQIESICRVNTLSSLPKEFYFFLKDNGYYMRKDENSTPYRQYMLSDKDNTEDDALPWLPPVFREFVSITPKDFIVSMVNALLPVLGTLTTYLKAKYYYDNREHTTSFFSIIYAPAGTGKGFAEDLIQDLLFEQIRIRDYVENARERIYLDTLSMKSQSEKSPERPQTSLRIISPKNSEAEFLQKQQDNHGAHMFTFAAEMDSWAKGVRAAGGNKDDMIRIAWDNGVYGQHFKSPSTFKGTVRLYWNVLITGTLQQILSYYKNIENGLITRCSFTTIDNQKFAEAPVWKTFSKRAIETIKRFTQRCDERTYEEPCTLLPEDIDIIERENFDKQVNWHFKIREREEVDMAWLRPTIEKFLKAQLQRASLDQDDARDVFRRRVAVRGFRLGMMCYALWDKPRPSDLQKCIPFIEWWMNKDIESSLQLWGERYNNETQAVPIMSQRSLYTALGDTFTKNDVYAQCLKQNIKTPVRKIVSLWCNQGHAKVIGKNEYQKTKPASK